MHHDAREPAAAENLGPLPEWDLGDLYASPHASELNADTEWLRGECRAFARDYEGKLAGLDTAGLLAAIRRYERIQSVSGRIMSYAGLRYYQNTTDAMRAKFFGDTQGALTEITTPLVFFTLELNRIDDAALDAVVAGDPALARYKPVLDRIRKMKPYQLSDELEKFLHDQSVVGAAAWNRLFDETMAGLRDPGGRRDAEPRGDARPPVGPATGRGGRRRRRRWRRRSRPAAALRAHHQHAGQGEGDRGPLAEVPDGADRAAPLERRGAGGGARRCGTPWSRPIPKLSHRYYALKAKWLGLDKLQVWDRNAPLAARGRPQDRLGGGEGDGARRLCRLRSAHGGPGASRSSSGAGSTPA